jgi:serine protease AprX
MMVLALLALLGQTTSAQLLSQLLQPVATTVTAVGCSVPLLSSPKLDAALQHWVQSGRANDNVQVIVSGAPGLLGVVEDLLAGLGSPLLAELPGINAIATTVDLPALSNLACAASVSSISIDAVVSITGAPTTDSSYTLRATLGLPPDTPGGAGVGVAVIDSGIASSEDFGDRIVASYDFTNDAAATAPSDAYGHGTHVAGLIGSAGHLDAGVTYQGIAPQVRLISMKVLDGTGSGRTRDVIRAVEYATAHHSSLGIQVINLSLGHPIYESATRDPLVRAVEAASRSGILVVIAAGNYGYDRASGQSEYGGILSPGNAPSAITVGAVMTENTTPRGDDLVAPYSSRGPTWYDGSAKPDLVAPGHGLVSNAAPGSTLYVNYPSARVSTSYLRLSGTSMAAAVMSGAVALIVEANRTAHPGAPPLTPNAVKAILEYSSLRMHDANGSEYDDLTQGAGALNASGALDLARAIDTSRPRGWYWWTTSVNPSTTIADQAWTWSQQIIWGTRIAWGTSIATNEDAWSLSRRWGGDATWDSHIVWGTDVVWGDNATIWPSHIVWGTDFVGSSTDGQHIVWGTADQPSSTVWGNLADSQSSSSGSDSTF